MPFTETALVVYPGAGHGLYASDHGALNADLLAFINGEGSIGTTQMIPHQLFQSERAKAPEGMS